MWVELGGSGFKAPPAQQISCDAGSNLRAYGKIDSNGQVWTRWDFIYAPSGTAWNKGSSPKNPINNLSGALYVTLGGITGNAKRNGSTNEDITCDERWRW